MSFFQHVLKRFVRKINSCLGENSAVDQVDDRNNYPLYIRLLELNTVRAKKRYLRTQDVIQQVEFAILECVLNEVIQEYNRRMISTKYLMLTKEEENKCKENFRNQIRRFIIVGEKCRRLYLAEDKNLYKLNYLGVKNAVKIMLNVFEVCWVYEHQMNVKVKVKTEHLNYKTILGFFTR